MAVGFIPVETEEEIEELAELAGSIWREYWPALIGEAQTEYMIQQFQSLEAIKRQLEHEDYEYWFIRAANTDDDGKPLGTTRIVGFTGGHNEPETNRFFISKIYLLAAERGRGFASQTIKFYEQLCRARGFGAMYLTVNKGNELGIRAYKGKGFDTIDAVETDIGEGYIMDDYIMEKRFS